MFDLVGALRVFDAIKRAAPRQVVRQPSDFVWVFGPSWLVNGKSALVVAQL